MQRLVKNRGTCIADDSIISRDRKLATQHGTVMLDPETFLTAMEDKLQRLDLLKGRLQWISRVPGGDINDAIRVADDQRDYFIKINRAELSPMFEAEAEALQLIARTATLTCPVPIAWGRLDRTAYLVLEYLQLSARGNDAALGEGLAAMHHCTSDSFGWHRDNYIGTTTQANTPSDDWIEFWAARRLNYQLQLARKNGHIGQLQETGTAVMEHLPALFNGYAPVPSLLHGDLWGGNCAFLAKGTPVIFDPASYYGDRETDLAMTELFGGFSAEFFAAYRAHWPIHEGYPLRRDLYQLYHVLNHLNLFGGHYHEAALKLMNSLLVRSR